MRNAEVIRQWKILKRIEKSRYVTAADLAEEHGVALRTIRRDIEALQEAGFPLYDDRESGRKIWRLLEGYQQKAQASFTMSEMAALYFGRHLMSILSGAPFAADLDSAFVKIRARPAREEHPVSRPRSPSCSAPGPSLPRTTRPRKGSSPPWWTRPSTNAGSTCPTTRPVRSGPSGTRSTPIGWSTTRAACTCTAGSEEYGEIRTFAVERIERIALMDVSFEMPKDHEIDAHTRNAFGIAGGKPQEVVLRFDPRPRPRASRTGPGTSPRRSPPAPTVRSTSP